MCLHPESPRRTRRPPWLAAVVLVTCLAPAARATPDGAWSEVHVPLPRDLPSMALDQANDRLLLYGGASVNQHFQLIYPNDLTSVPLTSPDWVSSVPSGGPGGRHDALAVFDPASHRMVLHGGIAGGPKLNDVWILDVSGTPTWSELLPVGAPPPARTSSAAIYDPPRDRLVLFGGSSASATYTSDVWALTLSGTPTWTPLAPAGTPPPARFGHAAAYDPVQDRMIVFGGRTESGYVNDVWALSLSGSPTWSQIVPTGTPPTGRLGPSTVFEPAGERMIVFGGLETGTFDELNDVWVLSLSGTPEWSQASPAGTAPGPRFYARATFDAARGRMLIHGGHGSFPDLTSSFPVYVGVWALDLSGTMTWVNIVRDSETQPMTFLEHAIYDPVGDRLITGGQQTCGQISGGWNTQALSLDGFVQWEFLGSNWAPLLNGYWFIADYTCLMVDTFRRRLIEFNAQDCHSGTIYEFLSETPLDGGPGEGITENGTRPSARYRSRGTYDVLRDRLLIYGGAGYPPLDDLWELGLSDPSTWSEMAQTNTLPIGPEQMLYDPVRDRLLAVNGTEAWALPLTGMPTWVQLSAGVGDASFVVYDPVRDRLVACADTATWALPLAGGPWIQLASTGTAPDSPFSYRGAYDPVRDRVLALSPSQPFSRTFALTFGEPARPSVACTETAALWTAGEPLPVPWTLNHDLAGDRAVEWRLESERDWPGFPLHGLEVVAGGAPHAFEIAVPVPDTASGFNTLRLVAWFAGGIGYDSECALEVVDAATLGVPSTEGAPLRVVAASPARRLRLALVLPASGPVRVEAFDLSGRRVAMRRFDGLGAGRHDVWFAGERLPPGVYPLRITQGGRTAHTRAVIVR